MFEWSKFHASGFEWYKFLVDPYFKWCVDIGHVWLVLEGVATLTLETFQQVMQVQKGENLEFSPADAST